ncbi:MAG: DAK2 domain-containing protein [Thermoleophilia bacterium]|nr:DAK2 domain-containing protein [Thermoleophilia bacterium]
MSELPHVRALVAGALAALDAAERRINDLNVYPVPDGDTGTNLKLTVSGIAEALEASTAWARADLARDVTRGALMAARGNSGVILSQIVRGAAEALARSDDLAAALRSASDAAYRGVGKPVEGTMLTVIRETAEAAERLDPPTLPQLVAAAQESVERTPEQLAVLKEAGVVDAGGAGLVEILRGLAAYVAGEPLPDPPAYEEEIGPEAVHQELSEFRYCTTVLLEGEELDGAAIERELEPLGDSLLVVGDPATLKIHVHTDDPGAVLSLAAARGTLESVEVANMHRQTAEREERLSDALAAEKTCEAVAVVAGAGNRRLFAGLGAGELIDGGRTMNPATQEILDAIERAPAPEAIVLPNNPNVIMSAEQAARHASKPVRVIPTRSLQEGLAALVAYDSSRSAEANLAEIFDALESVGTGAVTVSSRDSEPDGVAVRKGEWLGLVDGEVVVAAGEFDEAARAVLERLLAEPRDVVTLLAGEAAPALDAVRAWLEDEHPHVEVEVEDGGQPNYPLLVSAE